VTGGNLRVGRVLRASTRGFAIGCAVMQPEIPAFGSFVRADGQGATDALYGLITDVSVEDDLFVRQFISAGAPEEVVRDQRENRQVPIEVSVLAVGCRTAGAIRHCLPPQPPVTLEWLYTCTDEEIAAFTLRTDYFRLVLEARDVPVDEVLAASLRTAAAARPEPEREAFLVGAGRELTRLLSSDPVRLEGLLRRLHRY
jgi:hypothetical protein